MSSLTNTVDVSEENINPGTISNKGLEAALGGARPQIKVEGAKEGEVQIIKPDAPSDVTLSGVNKGVQIFG